VNWSAVEAVSTFVTAVVALYLLYQGQRERRRIRDDQRSAQARDVLVRVDENREPNEGRFKGAEVVVSNHSDRPIALEGLDYIRHHQPEHPDLGPVQVTGLDIEEHRLVAPTGSSTAKEASPSWSSEITTDSAGSVAATFRTSVSGRQRFAGGSAGFRGCVGRGPCTGFCCARGSRQRSEAPSGTVPTECPSGSR
jgi:hypothetical protein